MRSIGASSFAAIAAVLSGAQLSSAQTVVATQGFPAPDGNGSIWLLDSPEINDEGEVAFVSWLSGTDLFALDDIAVLVLRSESPRVAARKGDAIAGGALAATVDLGELNANGSLSFYSYAAQAPGLHYGDHGFFRADPDGTIVECGRIPADFVTDRRTNLTDSGTVYFSYFTTDGDGVVIAGDGTGPGAVAFFDDATTRFGLPEIDVHDAGGIVISATITDAASSPPFFGTRLAVVGGPAPRVVAQDGDLVPGLLRPISMSIWFLNSIRGDLVAVNANGDVAFIPNEQLTGQFDTTRNTALVVSSAGDALQALAAQGGTAPDGAVYDRFVDVAINDLGQIAYTATIVGGVGTSPNFEPADAVYLYDPLGDELFRALLRVGDQVDERTVLHIDNNLDMNNLGEVACLVRFDDGRDAIVVLNEQTGCPADLDDDGDTDVDDIDAFAADFVAGNLAADIDEDGDVDVDDISAFVASFIAGC